MRRIEKFLAVIGAAALLWVGSAVATQAGNGSALKFGKINKGTKTTTLQVTSGTASPLKLQGNASSAPLVTNMKGQVANLNASMVGGATLAPLTFKLPDLAIEMYEYPVTGIPAGTYFVSMAGDVDLTTNGSPTVPNVISCVLGYYSPGPVTMLQAESVSVGQYFYSSLSASKVINVAAGQNFVFLCGTTAATGWSPTGYAPSVTFQPIPAGTLSTLSNPATIPPTGPVQSDGRQLLGRAR